MPNITNPKITSLLNDRLWAVQNITIDDENLGGFAKLEHPMFGEVFLSFDKTEEQTLDEGFVDGFCDLLSESGLYSEEVLRQIKTNTNDNLWFEHAHEVIDELENLKKQNQTFIKELNQLIKE